MDRQLLLQLCAFGFLFEKSKFSLNLMLQIQLKSSNRLSVTDITLRPVTQIARCVAVNSTRYMELFVVTLTLTLRY